MCGVNILFAQITEDSVLLKPKVITLAKEFIQEAEITRDQINKRTLKSLQELQKLETQLAEKVPAEKLEEARKLKEQMARKMDALQGLSNPDSLLKSFLHHPYLSRFDSLQTLFTFSLPTLQNNPALEQAQQQIDLLKAQLSQLQSLETWMQEREGQWKNLFSQVDFDKFALPKAFGKWQEEAMSYKMQVQQWKETINDPQKIETEALRLLNKLPAFREFMSKNGELARLFGPPGGATNVPAGTPIPGLQTRQTLAQELQNRFGANALQSGGVLQQQLQNGMDQLSSQQQNPLNDLVNQVQEGVENITSLGEETASITHAQAERAGLKSKTFKQRIEFGWNMQSAVRLQDFPAVRDVGLSLGYKINPRSVIGIGVAYKFALGESWKDIEWTHEGVGLRSYLDWRMKEAGGKLFKNIWLTGGFEMNYWTRIANDVQWKDLAWQKSGLVGVTKTVKFKKKEGKIQLLWNFLNPLQANTIPIYFRISQNF